MTVPGAVELIRGAGADRCRRTFLLGAGTVTDADDGARGHRRGRPVRRRPGLPAGRDRCVPRARRAPLHRAASRRPRSSTAHELGADIVKVFPATALGPQYIKDVRAPLPQVKLMPTGGVTLDNAGDWIRAGAVAVGVGLGAARRRRHRERPARRDYRQRAADRRERRAQRGATTMSAKVVTFGELMLRLSPPGFERLLPVAGAVARPSAAARPTSPSASRISASTATTSRACRRTRLATPRCGRCAPRASPPTHVVRGGSRIGIYFAETGASQRASTVIYDRAHSSISEIPTGRRGLGSRDGRRRVVSRDRHHARARRATAAAATQAAVAAARRAGARVSVDLNYRKKLWTEAQAQATMRPLMRDVDVVIANEEDLQSVLGVHVAGADVDGGALDVAGYRAAAERVTREFGPALVAITLRESLSASDNGWSARAVGRRVDDPAPEPALRRPARRSHRRRRQLCGGPDLRADDRPIRTRRRCASPSPRAR